MSVQVRPELVEAPRPIIEIAPTSGWRAVDLRELWEYRELLHVLVWRDLKIRYRQTVLGVIWIVAQPLITMLIFTILFNRVARIQPDLNVPYSLFVMVALVPWTFFSSAVIASGNSLIGSSHLISKVYFPRMLVPAASVAGAALDMGVTLVLVAGMIVWNGTAVSWSVLALPLIILSAAIFSLGVGLWLSSLNVEYRDVRVVIPFAIQLWMYATPVVYPLSKLPVRYRLAAQLNPMTGIIEAFRAVLLGGPVAWASFTYATAMAVVVLASGAYYFRRTERRFADFL